MFQLAEETVPRALFAEILCRSDSCGPSRCRYRHEGWE
jgi:hypothetical protein